MNSEQIALVQTSFDHVLPIADTAAGLGIARVPCQEQAGPGFSHAWRLYRATHSERADQANQAGSSEPAPPRTSTQLTSGLRQRASA